MLNPFRMMVMAFRAAVRTEVERAMDDRRRALTREPDPIELARLRDHLAAHGVRTVMAPTAAILPFPANDLHDRPSPPAA